MKAQVFLPEELIEDAEAAAKEFGMPLRELIRTALAEFCSDVVTRP